MKNPFAPLQTVLSVLQQGAEVMPASGQAIEDLLIPNSDEIYDQQISGTATLRQIWETSPRIYYPVQSIHRTQNHALNYFVASSTTTYYIGTVLERERSSPIQIAQIGAAALNRLDTGVLQVAETNHKILLVLEKNQLSSPLWDSLQKEVTNLPHFALCDNSFQELNKPSFFQPRPRGTHLANIQARKMVEQFVETVSRKPNQWLVVNNSFGDQFQTWRGKPVISILKGFRRDNQFEIGMGPRQHRLSLYSLLKNLSENHRTALFSRNDEGKILFWYVRIRPQTGLDYPLMGVVKVELPNPTQEYFPTEQANEISSWIVAERSVTPYGQDSQWHAHLYPLFVAEQLVRKRFYSKEILRTGTQWHPHKNGAPR